MAARQPSWNRYLGWGVVIVLASSRMAGAAIDMTGRWLVTSQSGFGTYPKVRLWDIVQTDTSITYTGTTVSWVTLGQTTNTDTGEIDAATGVVSFPAPPPLPPGFPCDSDTGLRLQVAADGQSFTGSASHTSTYFDPNGNIGCVYETTSYVGSRCGDSSSAGGCLMLSGGGPTRTDCLHEWITPRAALLTSRAGQFPRLVCTDGDPTCDFDSLSNVCTFYLGMCFDVPDAALSCTMQGVSKLQFSGRSNGQLEQALADLGGQVQGVCGHTFAPCATDADCDSPPSSGNGVCIRRVITFPAGLTGQRCTVLEPISVPVGRRGFGTRTFTVRTEPTNASRARPLDTDRLTLVCRARP